MSYIFDNIIAILAATAAAWMFGAAWYGMLGKPWMKAAGLQESDIKGPDGKTSPAPFVLSFIFEFVMAGVLAGIIGSTPGGDAGWSVALGAAALMWLGFVLPTQLINHRYSMKPWSLTAIDAGHWLGVMLVMAIVLKLIGVDAPA